MTTNIYRPGVLLVLIAAALTAGLVALVSANPAWAESSRSFAEPKNFPVGSTPITVTNADFNADGKMDLAAQNYSSDSVSVLLGNGDGTFRTKQDSPVGSNPSSVTSADLNGDAKTDLAVANWSSNNVSVLLGNGDGTFQAKQNFAVGGSPSSVISADLNGDGLADLAIANYISSTVSVLLGQDVDGDGKADGTFQAKQDFSIDLPCGGFCIPATAGPNQVIAADFNGDTKTDLATANLGTCVFFCTPGGVSVLLGNGNGTFQSAKLAKINTTVTSIDTNGSANIVATEYDSNVVSVLWSNGNGTFSAGPRLPVGTNPSSVINKDLDGDSVADLAVANFASDNVSILWGNGGSFQSAENFRAGDGPIYVVGANLDADSFADLAVANQDSNNVSVLLNTPRPDTTAPITTRTLSPQPNANGWNNSDVTVTLNATDAGGSGVKEISYSVNGGAPTTVQQSSVQVLVTEEGETTISYHATDNANNAEAEKISQLKIDKSAPTLDTDSSYGSDGIMPNNRQSGVVRKVEPTATFSDEMDSASLRTSAKLYQWNALKKLWQRVPAAVSVDGRTATLDAYPSDPGRLLASNKKFKVIISTGAMNLAGLTMSSARGWIFTTR